MFQYELYCPWCSRSCFAPSPRKNVLHAFFPLQDLAEGEESNTQTNDTIWSMLQVPQEEFESRRGKHNANAGSGRRAPPPYNDRCFFRVLFDT